MRQRGNLLLGLIMRPWDSSQGPVKRVNDGARKQVGWEGVTKRHEVSGGEDETATELHYCG